jgi:hypothetical protein
LRLKRAKLLNELNSVQHRHQEISDHKIAAHRLKDFERNLSIARLENLVALLA